MNAVVKAPAAAGDGFDAFPECDSDCATAVLAEADGGGSEDDDARARRCFGGGGTFAMLNLGKMSVG